MKLRTKIAGTVALPLALAIASAANAATVVDTDAHKLTVGGFVAAQGVWSTFDAATKEDDFGMSLGTTRLNIGHTSKTAGGDVRVMYENDWAAPAAEGNGGYRLRHAAIFHDGWVAGFTWSFFSNLNGLADTVEANGNAVRSSATGRNAVLGKVIPLADGMSVGVALEDRGLSTEAMVPDISVNFNGDFGAAKVFAAAQQYQTGADSEMRITASVAVPAGPATVKAAFTNDADNSWLSVAGQFKVNDQVRTNLVVEQAMMDADDSDYTAIWVNAFYKMASGFEWGGELGTVSADAGSAGPALATGGKADGDMTFRLQAKYAF